MTAEEMRKVRWKPEEGERCYYVDPLGNVDWYSYNSLTDTLYYKVGNCFRTEEEAQHVSVLFKKLLEDCNQPTTNCSQLPKLTVEVFDRQDCPKWAKFAVVTADGTATWYGKRPFFNIHNNMWYPDLTDCCNRIIEGEYDASDWQNSLIERPKNTLPDWCKVGAICWHKRCGYFEVTMIDDFSRRIDLKQVADKSKGYLSFRTVCNDVCQARLRPYNIQEMKALVGKMLKHDTGLYLVTAYENRWNQVKIESVWREEGELLEKWTIDDMPCGVFEHLEDGEWTR